MPTDKPLETVEIVTHEPVSASVIWLHGLGADGNDFVPIVPELKLPSSLGVRFVFPHATVRPVTINMNMPMRAWFDILSLTKGGAEDDAGIRAAEQHIISLIEQEHARGIPYNRIILAGFSQGGSLALHTGLRFKASLAGIMALSTWLPLHESLASEGHEANKNTPIFMAHGSFDPVIQLQYGEQSKDRLVAAGYTVDWHSYPMQHQVMMDEINDISAWIQACLSSQS